METCYISSAEMLEVARYASLSPGTPEKRPMAITKHRIIAMLPVRSRLPDFQTHKRHASSLKMLGRQTLSPRRTPAAQLADASRLPLMARQLNSTPVFS